jgi:hypothetical protein
MEARHLMKRGLTAVLAGALAVVLLVPAAAATPGNGNGKGNGPPAAAGGGNGGGKPDSAGKAEKAARKAEQAARRAEQAARKAERRAAREGTVEDGDEPKHDNPAWVCKFERDTMGAEAFADEYGENENKADAFGKCVSQEAQDRDGVTPDDEGNTEDEDTTETGDEEAPASDELPDEDDSALPASVQAFLHYLWPLLF